MNWKSVWDTIINKLHVVLGCVVQTSVIVYHFKTHNDIGPGVTNTIFAFYAFLLGHAGVYQWKPDKDEQ